MDLFKFSTSGDGFVFHSDPDHAWLSVPVIDLTALGFSQSDFSKYSYRAGTVAYLEEDCDAPKFARRYVAKHGQPVPCVGKYHDGDSPIRNYRRLNS